MATEAAESTGLPDAGVVQPVDEGASQPNEQLQQYEQQEDQEDHETQESLGSKGQQRKKPFSRNPEEYRGYQLPVFFQAPDGTGNVESFRKMHLEGLGQLLRKCLVRRRYDEAMDIFELLVDSRGTSEEFLWKIGVEIFKRTKGDDADLIIFLQRLFAKAKYHKPAILLELVLRQMKMGLMEDAELTLRPYITMAPYNKDPLILGYAGLIKAMLLEKAERGFRRTPWRRYYRGDKTSSAPDTRHEDTTRVVPVSQNTFDLIQDAWSGSQVGLDEMKGYLTENHDTSSGGQGPWTESQHVFTGNQDIWPASLRTFRASQDPCTDSQDAWPPIQRTTIRSGEEEEEDSLSDIEAKQFRSKLKIMDSSEFKLRDRANVEDFISEQINALDEHEKMYDDPWLREELASAPLYDDGNDGCMLDNLLEDLLDLEELPEDWDIFPQMGDLSQSTAPDRLRQDAMNHLEKSLELAPGNDTFLEALVDVRLGFLDYDVRALLEPAKQPGLHQELKEAILETKSYLRRYLRRRESLTALHILSCLEEITGSTEERVKLLHEILSRDPTASSKLVVQPLVRYYWQQLTPYEAFLVSELEGTNSDGSSCALTIEEENTEIQGLEDLLFEKGFDDLDAPALLVAVDELSFLGRNTRAEDLDLERDRNFEFTDLEGVNQYKTTRLTFAWPGWMKVINKKEERPSSMGTLQKQLLKPYKMERTLTGGTIVEHIQLRKHLQQVHFEKEKEEAQPPQPGTDLATIQVRRKLDRHQPPVEPFRPILQILLHRAEFGFLTSWEEQELVRICNLFCFCCLYCRRQTQIEPLLQTRLKAQERGESRMEPSCFEQYPAKERPYWYDKLAAILSRPE